MKNALKEVVIISYYSIKQEYSNVLCQNLHGPKSVDYKFMYHLKMTIFTQ